MARCPNCCVQLPEESLSSCPKCGQALGTSTAGTGITATAPTAGGLFSESALPAYPDGDVPSIAKPKPADPVCSPATLIAVSGVFCAAQGAAMHFGKPGAFSFRTPETAVAGAIGIVIGIALACDQWYFQRKLKAFESVPTDDAHAPVDLRSVVHRPSDVVPILMLLLPIVATVVLWFSAPWHLSEISQALISSGAIVGTAVLGYVSIRQMALRTDRNNSYHGTFCSPAYSYLGILGLWVVFYPLHFIVRWRMGGRNLIVPGFLTAATYCVGTILPMFLFEAELPAADDAEVLSLVKQIVEDEPALRPVALRQPVEVSFDAAQQKRVGHCTVVSKFGEEQTNYTINWLDRTNGLWQVQLPNRLPFVDAPEVLDLVRKVIEDDPVRRFRQDEFGNITIRKPAQISFDPAQQRRVARAALATKTGELPFFYVVDWQNRDKAIFQVAVHDRQP